ncbi:hypothetical protein EVAR_30724_1 [Eumeta japonica]|uniref:Uncharacterized protein n=1 Tax=Eumeta variegata TaxID=151549 RepID=A0A4C1V777_EUMVA|nr:hypothetical protein EVAR_30724_1 [Eumeta japonica]
MTDMAVSSSHGNRNAGLSVFFTVLCIIDLFVVFPIVALPKSVIACGVYGAPLVMFVLRLQLYTASLLGRSWLSATRIAPHIDQKIRYPYAAVAELAFGRRMRQLVTFFIDATVFGAGVPNILKLFRSRYALTMKASEARVPSTGMVSPPKSERDRHKSERHASLPLR